MRARLFHTILGAMLIVGAAAAASTNSSRPVDSSHPDSGAELIGTPAPKWTFDRWLRTKPMSVESLRGKVVLLRWWTEQCHFCRTTLPVLEQVRREHPDLVVIGVFHPKPPRKVSDQHILEIADQIGFDGPIAVDQAWKTLNRYWLDANPERNWTSVSFLIDRQGRIRWVHGGGEYHPSTDPAHARCNKQYEDFEQHLTTLLNEPKAAN
jgi:thiol-disulfide isomerase/thioredoxin